MRHVTYMNGCVTWLIHSYLLQDSVLYVSHATHMNESCHTNECKITTHTQMQVAQWTGILVLSAPTGTCAAVCCSVLQCPTVCCSVLQRAAVRCRIMSHTRMPVVKWSWIRVVSVPTRMRVVVCCSVLQCAAVCCSVLQCAAVCCGAFARSCRTHECRWQNGVESLSF